MPFKLFTRAGKFVANIGSVSHLPDGKVRIHDHQELPTCFIGTLIGRMEDVGLTSGRFGADATWCTMIS